MAKYSNLCDLVEGDATRLADQRSICGDGEHALRVHEMYDEVTDSRLVEVSQQEPRALLDALQDDVVRKPPQ